MTDNDRLLPEVSANISYRETTNRSKNILASVRSSKYDHYGTTSGEQQTADKKQEEAVEFPSYRHILYLMMFLGFVVAYSLRGCFNEAIVAMVNQTAVSEQTVTANVTNEYQCPRDPRLQRGNGEFTWNRSQQGILLAAFYYGYILTQVSHNFHLNSCTEYRQRASIAKLAVEFLPAVNPPKFLASRLLRRIQTAENPAKKNTV